MERGLLKPKLMLSQDISPEDREAMVVMDVERGLLKPKLMLSQDISPEDMEAMVVMDVAMEVMVVMDVAMDMARGLLMLETMVDMAAVMEAMAEAMVMVMESNCHIRYIFHLSSKLISQYKLNKLGTILKKK